MAEVNEKVQNHAEEDFATLLEEYDAGKSRDEVVTGKVIALKDGEVFIDVGRKSEGILDAAEQHHVQVIWMGIPYMKQAKLNKQMRYLDKLLADEISPKALWIPTDKLLSNGSDTYADSVNINGKIIRYRSKDGIHFSAEGQKLLADKIMEKIVFQTTPEMNGEERTEQLSAR